MRKDVRELVEELRHQGWRVEPGTSGKLICKSPDGVTIVVLHGTPSDFRWRRNAISQLKRGGFKPKRGS